MRIILFFSFFFFLNTVFSQECFPNRSKYVKLVAKIEKCIKNRAYYDALNLLYESNNASIFFVLRSEVLYNLGNLLDARIEAFKAIDACAEDFPKLYYILGVTSYEMGDYINSAFYLNKSLEMNRESIYYSRALKYNEKAKILDSIINNPVSFKPILVKNVSTKDDEYLPIISPDQDLLFFTRRSDKVDLNLITNRTIEEFFCSRKLNGEFQDGNALAYPFNLGSNEGGASISIDNNILYYTKCIREKNGYNNCDIYYVTREGEGWSNVYEFSKNISKIDSWESQPTVSSDGNKIIFSSDRTGGYGKMDLYEINKINGVWANPKNLGAIVNSRNHEKSPYLHADGKTLFFASTNFPSLGGFDIFLSRMDSLGNWQRPVNIGFPINSIADEISLYVRTDGKCAYFASNTLNGTGGWDIYTFTLHENAKPGRVLFLRGNLLSKNIEDIIDIELEIKNLSTQEITLVKVDSGSYVSSIALQENDDILITIKKEGLAFKSKYISSEDSIFYSPTNLDFKIQTIDEGMSFDLENIYFESKMYNLQSSTKDILIEFSKYLRLNSSLVIQINGFTDSVGDELYNKKLSEKRAHAVRDFILSQGVSKDRVFYSGMGESFPKATNETNKGREANRRTEFEIISK